MRLYSTHKTAGGEIRDIDFSLKPLRDESGRITHLIFEGRDVTELKQAQRGAADAKEAAEAANQAKSHFLANMSHEIRTPMAAILGYSDLMLDPNRKSSAKLNDLHAIRRNGQHLLELISDVLDLSKIEADRMTVEKIPTDLLRLVAEAVSMSRPKAIEKGLQIKLEFATPVAGDLPDRSAACPADPGQPDRQRHEIYRPGPDHRPGFVRRSIGERCGSADRRDRHRCWGWTSRRCRVFSSRLYRRMRPRPASSAGRVWG